MVAAAIVATGNTCGDCIESDATMKSVRKSTASNTARAKLNMKILKRQSKRHQGAHFHKTTLRNDDDLTRMLSGLGNYYVDYAGAIRAEGYETIDELKGLEIDELIEMGVKKRPCKKNFKGCI